MSFDSSTGVGSPPPPDPPAFWKGGASQNDTHLAAAVCRRGHPQWSSLNRYPKEDQGCCAECGASVLVECPQCGLRIRGTSRSMTSRPGRAVSPDYSLPNFCDGCGASHPWASRQARLYELENLLDEADIDEADRLVVTEHLRQLQELDPDEDRDHLTKLWSAVKRRAPGLFVGAGGLITKTLIDDTMRRAL